MFDLYLHRIEFGGVIILPFLGFLRQVFNVQRYFFHDKKVLFPCAAFDYHGIGVDIPNEHFFYIFNFREGNGQTEMT